MEFFHKVTRFPFMNTRKIWYGVSAVLIVASLALVAFRGLNLGIDFTGGVVVDVVGETAPGMAKPASAVWESAVLPPACAV